MHCIHTSGIESTAPTTTETNHRASKAPLPYKTTEYVSSGSNCKYSRSHRYGQQNVKLGKYDNCELKNCRHRMPALIQPLETIY